MYIQKHADDDYVYESQSDTDEDSEPMQGTDDYVSVTRLGIPLVSPAIPIDILTSLPQVPPVRESESVSFPILVPVAPAGSFRMGGSGQFVNQMSNMVPIPPIYGSQTRIVRPPVRYGDEYVDMLRSRRFPRTSARQEGLRKEAVAVTYSDQESRRSALGLRTNRKKIDFTAYDDILGSSSEDDEYDDDDDDDSRGGRGKRGSASMPVSGMSSRASSPLNSIWSDPASVFEEPTGMQKLLGRRYIQESPDTSKYSSPQLSSVAYPEYNGETKKKKEFEYLVKYKNKSYIHTDWISEKQILSEKGGQLRVKAFEKRLKAGIIDNEEPINPEFTTIERIVAYAEVEVPLPGGEEEEEEDESGVFLPANRVDDFSQEVIVEISPVTQSQSQSQSQPLSQGKQEQPATGDVVMGVPEAATEANRAAGNQSIDSVAANAEAQSVIFPAKVLKPDEPAVPTLTDAPIAPNEPAGSAEPMQPMDVDVAGDEPSQHAEDDEQGAAEEASQVSQEPEEQAEPREKRKVYLVKWRLLQYEECSWEFAEMIDDDYQINEFKLRSTAPDLQDMAQTSSYGGYNRSLTPFKKFESSDEYRNDNELRDYQVEGLNWLAFSWHQNRNVILADEMGLGKTIQCVALLNYLFKSQGVRGPFLIVAPLSTLPHWERTFEGWTHMNAIVFHGSQESRRVILNHEFYYENYITRDFYKFNAIITTYEMIMASKEILADIDWKYMIVDEAHRLKNRDSKLIGELREFSFEACLLMTGTPLQNNTEELWTLLNFMEPHKFHSLSSFLEKFGELKEAEQVSELHRILAPHFLRRMKENVEKSIAPKEETIVEVELTKLQKMYYVAIYKKNFEHLHRGAKSSNLPSLINIFMELRKCCNHPYLVHGVEESVRKEMKEGVTQAELMDTLIKASGKLVLVDKLLAKLYREGNHKVLVFSQFTRVLDILEDYLVHRSYSFERIDGQVRGNDRQEAIDRFNGEESDRFVFLLCTRAGGLGINLTAADIVIMYDSDWNPQNDIQAQARCHRIGQTKSVKIYRLVTGGTYESVMFQRANLKLGLDHAVLGRFQGMGGDGETIPTATDAVVVKAATGNSSAAAEYRKEIDRLLKFGYFREDNNAASEAFCEADIDNILRERSSTITRDSSGAVLNNQYAKAQFVTSDGLDVNIDDPDFWEKVMPDTASETKASKLSSLNDVAPRRRRVINRYGMVNEEDAEFYGSEWYNFSSKIQEMRNQRWKKSERQRMINSLKAFGVNRWGIVQHLFFPGRSPEEVLFFGITMIELGINISTKVRDTIQRKGEQDGTRSSKSKREDKEKARIVASLTEYIEKMKEQVMEALYTQSDKSDWKRFEKKMKSLMEVLYEEDFKSHLERNSYIIFNAIDVCAKLHGWMQEYNKLVAEALEVNGLSETTLDEALEVKGDGRERPTNGMSSSKEFSPYSTSMLLIEKLYRFKEVDAEKCEKVKETLHQKRLEWRKKELDYGGYQVKPMSSYWSADLDDELLIGYSIHGFGRVEQLKKDANLHFGKLEEELTGVVAGEEEKVDEKTASQAKSQTQNSTESQKGGAAAEEGQSFEEAIPSAQHLNKRAKRLLHHFHNTLERIRNVGDRRSIHEIRKNYVKAQSAKVWTKKEKLAFLRHSTLHGLPFVISTEIDSALVAEMERKEKEEKEAKNQAGESEEKGADDGRQEAEEDAEEDKTLTDKEVARLREKEKERLLNSKWQEWHVACKLPNKTMDQVKEYAVMLLSEAKRVESEEIRRRVEQAESEDDEEGDSGVKKEGAEASGAAADETAGPTDSAMAVSEEGASDEPMKVDAPVSEIKSDPAAENAPNDHPENNPQESGSTDTKMTAKESMRPEITYKQAALFLKRQRFLKFLHTSLYGIELNEGSIPEGSLDDTRSKLPDWWIPYEHDLGLVKGVLLHGFDVVAIEQDINLPFIPLFQKRSVAESDKAGYHPYHAPTFPGTQAVMKRLEVLVNILNPEADLRNSRRRGREDAEVRDDDIVPNSGRKPRTRGKKEFYELPANLPPVEYDEDGKVKTPIVVNSIAIVDFGKIVPELYNFHNEKYIWPVGFTSERYFYSTIVSDQKIKYRSEIRERNGSPLFVVTPSDCPDKFVVHTSPSGAWLAIVRQANEIRSVKRKDKNLTISGPEAFGIAHPLVQKVIQEMPGAELCTRYRMKKFKYAGAGRKRSGWSRGGDASGKRRWDNSDDDTVHTEVKKAKQMALKLTFRKSDMAESDELSEAAEVMAKVDVGVENEVQGAEKVSVANENSVPKLASKSAPAAAPPPAPAPTPVHTPIYFDPQQIFRVPAYHVAGQGHDAVRQPMPQPQQLPGGQTYWFPYQPGAPAAAESVPVVVPGQVPGQMPGHVIQHQQNVFPYVVNPGDAAPVAESTEKTGGK